MISGFELQRIKLLAEADKSLSSASSSIRASESSEGYLWLDERPLLLSAIKFLEKAKSDYNEFLEFMRINGRQHTILDETGKFFREPDIAAISAMIQFEIDCSNHRYFCFPLLGQTTRRSGLRRFPFQQGNGRQVSC